MLFFGEMQKKFSDKDPIARQIPLESVDVLVAFFPDVLGDEALREFLRAKKRGMHADDENFFVIGAVEDADFAALRNGFVIAPEVVVVQLFGAG